MGIRGTAGLSGLVLVGAMAGAGCANETTLPDLLHVLLQEDPASVLVIREGPTSDVHPDRVPDLVEFLRHRFPALEEETVRSFVRENGGAVAFDTAAFADPRVAMLALSEHDEMFRDAQGWRRFYERFPGSRGLFTLSLPGLSPDGNQALLYVGRASGWLDGRGRYLLFERDEQRWRIVASVQVWVS